MPCFYLVNLGWLCIICSHGSGISLLSQSSECFGSKVIMFRLFTYFLIRWLLMLFDPCGFSTSWWLAWFLTHKLNRHSWLLSELLSHMDFLCFQPIPAILTFVVFLCLASHVALGCFISISSDSIRGCPILLSDWVNNSSVGGLLTSSSSIWHNPPDILNHEVNFISNKSKALQQKYFIIKEYHSFLLLS